MSAINAANATYRARKRTNAAMLAVSGAALAFGLLWLVWILATLLYEGGSALSRASLYTQMTPPPGADGGLANAIVGSLIMVASGTLIGTPVGILAGTYCAEYGRSGWLASATRFLNDVLLSAPSIVIGLFVYSIYVARVGHFSGWAGSVALGLLVVPVVVRTTDDMGLLAVVLLGQMSAEGIDMRIPETFLRRGRPSRRLLRKLLGMRTVLSRREERQWRAVSRFEHHLHLLADLQAR